MNDSFAEFVKEQKIDEEADAAWSEDSNLGFTPTSWENLSAKEFPEIRWRIKNLIPAEGFVILSSTAGTGKTWVAMDMAGCIVQEKNFLGTPEFETVGGNVLYINAENPEAEMQRRGKQLGFDDERKHKLIFLNEGDINLNDDERARDLIWLLVYHDIKVVFIDTFRAVAGPLKEDKSEEVRMFFNRFSELKNKGIAVVWLMHMRKPQHFEGKTPKKEQLLGSQDKAASVEVLIMIHSELRSGVIKAYQTKNRLAPEITPFEMTMKDTVTDKGTTTAFSYAGTIKDEENKKEMAKELILNLLGSVDGYTSREILNLTSKEVGQKNTRNALTELTKEGVIDSVKHGKQNYYFLPKGGENNGAQTETDSFFDNEL